MFCRVRRKDEQQLDRRRQALGLPDTVPLLPESPADARSAALVTFGDSRAFEKARSISRNAIQQGSIFSSRAVAAGQQRLATAAAAAVCAEKGAAARVAAAAAGRSSGIAGRSLPRVAVVQRRRGEPALQIPTIERRDRGSLANLAKPPLAQPTVGHRVTAPSASIQLPAGASSLGISELHGRGHVSAVRGSGGAIVVKRRCNDAAAQLEMKRRRLEHGVKLRLTEPHRR